MTAKYRKKETELLNEFTKKGFHTIKQRREVVSHVLGGRGNTVGLSDESIDLVLTYLHEIEGESLQLPIMAWVSTIDPNEGMTNKHMRVLLAEIPPKIHVLPIFIEAGSSAGNKKRIVGYIDKDLYENYADEIQQELALQLDEGEHEELFVIQGKVVQLIDPHVVKPSKEKKSEPGIYVSKPTMTYTPEE